MLTRSGVGESEKGRFTLDEEGMFLGHVDAFGRGVFRLAFLDFVAEIRPVLHGARTAFFGKNRAFQKSS